MVSTGAVKKMKRWELMNRNTDHNNIVARSCSAVDWCPDPSTTKKIEIKKDKTQTQNVSGITKDHRSMAQVCQRAERRE